jgi:RimJ/RimL family protein N-acetyltransferase
MSGTTSHSPRITFRSITAADLSRLHEWVQRPHVAQWWEEPSSMHDIREEYLPVVEGRDSTRAWIAYEGDEPIGFIQAYVLANSGDGWWPDEKDPGARGIDQFLLDERRLGQGLGTVMVRSFVELLFGDPQVTVVQTDPAPHNARAIRCYEKAGFHRVGIVQTPDGAAHLMRCPRTVAGVRVAHRPPTRQTSRT